MENVFNERVWQLAHERTLTLGRHAVIMGIVNLTPDSFSDGGQFSEAENAVQHAIEMAGEGAQIIDIGGESSRPGAQEVSAIEEQRRILPVVEALAGIEGMLMSVDTWRADTADLALKAGAHIINDIWGLQRDVVLARVIASHGAGCIIMHTGRGRERMSDIVADQLKFLGESLEIADKSGIERDRVVLDPGFGFAKETVQENIGLLARLNELHGLGLPLMVGASRKRFIGTITGKAVEERTVGTSATSVVARMKGAALFRVHDVGVNADALKIADALIAAETGSAT